MDQESIKSNIEEIITHIGFSDVVVEIAEVEGGYEAQLSVLPEFSGMLIGHHGEGIDALQTIANLMHNNQKEVWTRITLNINDYRQQRDEIIKSMVSRAAESAKSTSKEIVLNFLPSHERRIAHMYLEADEAVQTYSEGRGKNRRMVISPVLPDSPTEEDTQESEEA